MSPFHPGILAAQTRANQLFNERKTRIDLGLFLREELSDFIFKIKLVDRKELACYTLTLG